MPTIGMAGASHGCRQEQGGGHKPQPHAGVCEQSYSSSGQPLHRAGLTNSSAQLMTHRDCGDMGSARQTDGQQLLRMAVLSPALETFPASPLSSQPHFPGLMLMAKFAGGAMS